MSRLLNNLPSSLKQAGVVVSNYRGMRNTLLRSYLFGALRRVTPSVAVERDGIWYFVATADQHLSRHTFAWGEYEQDLLADAISVLSMAQGNRNPLEGGIFIDVGANIGTTIIPAVKLFGAQSAFGFEPAPNNYKLLRCNVIANGIESRVTVYNTALSDSSAIRSLELSSKNWGDHRLRAAGVPSDEAHSVSVQVPTTTFDQFLLNEPIDVDSISVVWMDTQGHEGHILAGAQRLVCSSVPVVCEYWPYGLRRSGGLDLLHKVIGEHYSRVIDLRAPRREGLTEAFPAKDVSKLEHVYADETYTDLVLLTDE